MTVEGYGLLIDNSFCTGCHSCEIACKKEHGLELDQWGIKLCEIGPFMIDDDPDHRKWEFKYAPVPTSMCDLCEERVGLGLKPACVVNCQGLVIEYGPVEELAKRASEIGKNVSVFIP